MDYIVQLSTVYSGYEAATNHTAVVIEQRSLTFRLYQGLVLRLEAIRRSKEVWIARQQLSCLAFHGICM